MPPVDRSPSGSAGGSPPPGPGGSPPVRQDGALGLGRQLLGLLAWVALALVLRWQVVEPRWIPSGSMLPNLQLQDRILVEKLRPRLGMALPAGTVVVFRPPPVLLASGYDPDTALIKRVVAAAGERVEVRDGSLWRNGERLSRDWAAEPMDYRFGPLTVPADHVLVLGDNRNASLDSHLWGPLPRRQIIGTAVWRYWPLQRFGPLTRDPAPAAGSAEGLG